MRCRGKKLRQTTSSNHANQIAKNSAVTCTRCFYIWKVNDVHLVYQSDTHQAVYLTGIITWCWWVFHPSCHSRTDASTWAWFIKLNRIKNQQAVGGRPPRYASAPLQVNSIFVFIRQVAVLFRHNNIFVFIRQVAPIPACWLFETSATSWPLTFWSWNWCPSDVWRGLLLCQFYSSYKPLCSRVRTDVRDRQTSDRQGRRHNNRLA